MDSVILAEKLESLRRCIRRVQDKRAATAAELRADVDRQDIVALNLSRAVQVCVDVAAHVLAASEEPAPATMGEAFTALERMGLIDSNLCYHMKAAVGFRNIAVHSYQEIDWEIVHALTWQYLDDFRKFAQAVSKQNNRA